MPGYNPDLTDAAGRKGKDALTPDLDAARKLASAYAAEKCGGDYSKCPPIVFSDSQGAARAIVGDCRGDDRPMAAGVSRLDDTDH